MKKILLLIAFSAIYTIGYCQTHTETFSACTKSYTVICELQEGNKIIVTFIDGLNDSNKKSYPIVTTDIEQFAKSFGQFFFDFIGNDISGCTQEERDNGILVYGRKLFLNFKAALTKDGESPIAGILSLRDSVMIYNKIELLDTSGKTYFLPEHQFKKYKLVKVTAEINNGFIENIKACIKINDQNKYFTIPYPAGISSVDNFKKYYTSKLLDIDSRLKLKTFSKTNIKYKLDNWPDKKKRFLIIDSIFYLNLNDVLLYDYYYGVERRDYSPQNMTIEMMGGESKILHKDSTSKLFEAHIYTDFIGLQEDKPNGLVQTEVSKRINIHTVQKLSNPWLYWLFRSNGWFQYIAPSITISKLEQHNKRLLLNDLDSVRLQPGETDTSKFNRNLHRYANALNLYQYQSFSAGFDWNIKYLSNHDSKYDIYFNVGARIGITPVVDSLTTIDQSNISKTRFVNEYTVNSIQLYPEIVAKFLPEERFNFSISDRVIYFQPINQNVQLVSTDKHNNAIIKAASSSWLNSFELQMAIQVNSNSKLFGRVRLISELQNMKNNFAQIQVGYSFYILGNK